MSKSSIFSRLAAVFPSKTQQQTPKKPLNIPKPEPKLTPTPPPRKTLNQELKSLLQEKQPHLLVQRFKYLSQFSYFRENCRDVYKLTIHRLALAKQFDLVEEALESQMKYVNGEGFGSRIMHLYGRYGMFEKAYKVFDEMPKRKLTRGVKSFAAVLGAASNSGEFDKVWVLFRQLPGELGVKPNVDCYNTAMHALCKVGKVEDAVKLLDEMIENGLKPDFVSFNTLFCVYYEGGEGNKGDELWERMMKSNVVPNIHSYNFKLQGLINDGKLSEAVELGRELEYRGMKPDVSTFNVVIKGLIKDDDLDSVREWYEKLVKSGCLPNKITFSTLVPFLCEKGDYELAFKLCKNMFKGRSCSVDKDVLQNVVDGLVKNSMADKAKVLVELGQSNSYAPYNLVMQDSA